MRTRKDSRSDPPGTSVDAVLSRDRGRLLRLRAAAARAPGDPAAQAAFAGALAASRAAVAARAAAMPMPVFDETLPVAREAGDIAALIRAHPVVVVAGETGSGKTTQLPKICLAAGRGAAGMIGCTQPRRIAARAVARRVAEELGSPSGGFVGYQVRFNDNVGEQTVVKFMTDGILLAEIQSDRWLSKYDTLIVDEAHERSLNIDFLLGYLKQLVAKRPDLKLVITSATIDTERFARHFDGAPVVTVEGRSYPVEVRYRPAGGEDDASAREVPAATTAGVPAIPAATASGNARPPAPATAAARAPARPGRERTRRSREPEPISERPLAESIVHAADEITAGDPLGDILVFLPGEREIRDAHAALDRRKYRSTEVIPLYARLSARDQDRVFSPGPGRRIVLATNVAETSLTVPRIRYVIDPGVARVKRYSPRGRLDRLHIEPVSQASADQRKGRCGRVAAGVCYRLYSEADFLSRPRYTDPEILRASLAGVILRMLVLGLGRVEDFPFIDPPDPRAVAEGWQTLAELGAIDDRRALTATGREMARLPVDPKLARMLVAAGPLGVLEQVLVIAAFLGIQDPRERPSDARAKADEAHAAFADPSSEFVGILNLWEAYRIAHEELTQSKLRAWCERHFLGFLRMREWRELHRQLLLATEENRGQVPSHSSAAKGGRSNVKEPDPGFPAQALHRALLAGLPAQIGHRLEKGLYEAPRQRKFQLFPGSALAKTPPAWVLVATLLDTQRVWGLMAAKIEPDWVIAELPHLLSRRHFDPHWSRKQGRVIGSEQISLFGLVLAPKKPVHYGGLYPAEGREIFVRQGLVPGEADLRAPFLKRNLATLEKAREEEAKLRRAGLVADEDWQARWYLDRVPPEVNSVAGLDSAYARMTPGQKKAFEWSLADLLPGEGSEAERFPKYFALGDARLALHYRFEPGHPDDGVTLDVPLHLLQALDAARLTWLVPGLVEEKATALIRGLPKALRRNYVPAPDFARAFAEAHAPRPGVAADATTPADDLPGTLARFLTKATGAPVTRLDFDEPALDPHLRMNLRLGEPDGRVLATSRDLDALRARFGEQAEKAFADRAGERLARGGLVRFPDEPVPVRIAGAAGVPAFPALVDTGDSVSLSVFADAGEAAREHARGVERLARLALADRAKQARRQLPVSPKLALLYATIEGFGTTASPSSAPPVPAHEQLRADLADAALAAVLAGAEAGEVRTPAAFAALVDRAGRTLFAEAMTRLQLAEAILAAVADLKPRLESPLLGWARGNLDDLKAQLAGLVPPGFLRSTPAEALAELPRYLKALSLRAERALRDPVRDQARMLELKPFADALDTARRAGRAGEPAWQALRWDLEELRVSTFAQELGTRRQVSAKRLSRQVQALG